MFPTGMKGTWVAFLLISGASNLYFAPLDKRDDWTCLVVGQTFYEDDCLGA